MNDMEDLWIKTKGYLQHMCKVHRARVNCRETELNHTVPRSPLATPTQSLIRRSLVLYF